jgi:hypothetical protein
VRVLKNSSLDLYLKNDELRTNDYAKLVVTIAIERWLFRPLFTTTRQQYFQFLRSVDAVLDRFDFEIVYHMYCI